MTHRDCAPSSETENSLAEQLGGYEHVKVERDMGPATVDLLRSVPGIKAGTAEGDWLDARAYAFVCSQALVRPPPTRRQRPQRRFIAR